MIIDPIASKAAKIDPIKTSTAGRQDSDQQIGPVLEIDGVNLDGVAVGRLVAVGQPVTAKRTMPFIFKVSIAGMLFISTGTAVGLIIRALSSSSSPSPFSPPPPSPTSPPKTPPPSPTSPPYSPPPFVPPSLPPSAPPKAPPPSPTSPPYSPPQTPPKAPRSAPPKTPPPSPKAPPSSPELPQNQPTQISSSELSPSWQSSLVRLSYIYKKFGIRFINEKRDYHLSPNLPIKIEDNKVRIDLDNEYPFPSMSSTLTAASLTIQIDPNTNTNNVCVIGGPDGANCENCESPVTKIAFESIQTGTPGFFNISPSGDAIEIYDSDAAQLGTIVLGYSYHPIPVC